MNLLVNDCRKDLEDCLDYLADYWQEDLDVDPAEGADAPGGSRAGDLRRRGPVAQAARGGIPRLPPLVPGAQHAHPQRRLAERVRRGDHGARVQDLLGD